MAITDKKQGVWDTEEVYNKINQGGIWTYSGSEKSLFAWGYNNGGQLGLNDRITRSSPVMIPGSTWRLKTATVFGYGSGSILHTKTDGTLWTWGGGQRGNPGLNSLTSVSSPTQIGTNTNWAWVFSTYQNGYATKTDGTLWSWGGNGDGQLGLNASGDNEGRSSPTQIGTGTDWSTADHSIAGARGGVWALKTDGTLYSWGDNTRGMLGHSDQSKYSSPKQIPGTTWRSVGCGYNAFFGTKTDGTLWGQGEALYGQLAQSPATTDYSSPRQIPGTNWGTIISASYYGQIISTKTDGTLWTWGNGQRGALGNNTSGPTSHRSSPVQVPGTWTNKVQAIRFGVGAIKADGTLWVWGDNYQGMLGLNAQGDANRKSSPTQIPGTGWEELTGTSGQYGGYFALKSNL
tara:strand:- start:295 stop:1503 length:1209 start_codon:yes stop_codon:yes gene_type:complete